MSDIAIRVQNLSKQYKIGVKSHDRLKDLLAYSLNGLFRRSSRSSLDSQPSTLDSPNPQSEIRNPKSDYIWALKEVSFEVKQGETLGIIGPNGAGKSTLLKILSRITEPTSGRGEIFGRVGSLLEVGTGFDRELTGRENIYLNGAILGMTKREIGRKFDEIVDFSGVEKFIDTPVKRYSSGMYVRLAFAVAAHLEPEILIVDEVLSVGDAAFQKKCLTKMQDVGKRGRTVLFVSHNMSAIARLCERVILLDEGKVVADGLSHQVVSAYLSAGIGATAVREWPDHGKAPGRDVARLRAVRVRTEDGRIADAVDIRRPVAIEMEYDVLLPGYVLSPYYEFYNEEGVPVFSAADLDPAWRRRPRPIGRYVSTTWVPGNLLSEGTLLVAAGLATMDPVIIQFHERDVVAFHVIDTLDGDSARGDWSGPWEGFVRPLLKWNTRFSPNE